MLPLGLRGIEAAFDSVGNLTGGNRAALDRSLRLPYGDLPLLLGGDIIVEMNSQELGDPTKMGKIVTTLKVGEPVRLTVVRGDQTLHLEITLEERPILPQDVSQGRAATPASGQIPSSPARRSL